MKKADPQASMCVADEYGVLNETIVGKGNGACGVEYQHMFGSFDLSLKIWYSPEKSVFLRSDACSNSIRSLAMIVPLFLGND